MSMNAERVTVTIQRTWMQRVRVAYSTGSSSSEVPSDVLRRSGKAENLLQTTTVLTVLTVVPLYFLIKRRDFFHLD
jgi:hypothetical protein